MEARRRTGSQASVRQPAPNPLWTSDITDLWPDEGWLHLAIVLDLFNREVLGWSLKPTADIVTDALTVAWFRKQPAPGPMHPADRVSQYASHAFQDKLTADGMTCSMSRKGNGWDNAPTESRFSTLGYKSPVPFLENWISEQQQEALTA